MINTLQELLEDYARFSCMEDRIDPETSEELQKGAKDYLKQLNELDLLTLTDVGSSLPDLAECNQASLDYATKKDNPDFFLIKRTFKEGINWALNYVTKKN